MGRKHVSMQNYPLSAPNVGTHTEKLNPVGKNIGYAAREIVVKAIVYLPG